MWSTNLSSLERKLMLLLYCYCHSSRCWLRQRLYIVVRDYSLIFFKCAFCAYTCMFLLKHTRLICMHTRRKVHIYRSSCIRKDGNILCSCRVSISWKLLQTHYYSFENTDYLSNLTVFLYIIMASCLRICFRNIIGSLCARCFSNPEFV